MKKGLRTLVNVLLVLCICAGIAVPAASAATINKDAVIPIRVDMKGAVLPESDDVYAAIVAKNGAPAPRQTEINITCKGKDGKGVGEFVIPQGNLGLGFYSYDVTIGGGDYYLAEYGEAVTYEVLVQVTNNKNYTGYDITTIAYKVVNGVVDKSTKYTELVDENTYLTPISVTVNKKWVDQQSHRTSSVDMKLYCDGHTTIPEAAVGPDFEESTVKLTADGSKPWQYTWTGLHPGYEWDVKEVKVPAGYTASYKVDKETNNWIITVTNTGSLMQTGQLNWPIPVLCAGGLALMVIGFLMMRKRQEENG